MAVFIGDSNPNSLTGGNGADTLEGNQGADVLRGGAGNDRLFDTREANTYEDGAADQLFGEGGDDYLLVHAGDSADGGAGNDVVDVRGDNPLSLAGGTGTDTLRVGDGINVAGSLIGGFERLEVAPGGNNGAQLAAAQLSLFTTIGAIGGGNRVFIALTGGGVGELRLDPAITTADVRGSTVGETLTMAAGSTASLLYLGGSGAATVTGGAANDTLEGN